MSSQWNLSVRLTGQGSDLARTLRSTSRDARAASRDVNALRRDLTRLRNEARTPIRVRINVDGTRLRSDVRAALTAAGTGQGLGVRLGIDASQLRSDVTRALAAAGAGQGLRVRLGIDAARLRSDVRTALTAAGSGQGLAVNLRLGNAMDLRREVEAAVRWAAWGHRITIPIGLADPMQLRRDVTAAVRWAQMNQVIRLRVDADTSGLGDLTRTLRAGGGSSGGGLQSTLRGLLLLAPAVIPLVAGLSTSLAPLPGAFAAATIPAAAFGAALAGQIGPLTEVAEAQTKYEDTVREHGKASAEAMKAQIAYQRLLSELPPEAQRAAIAVSGLKDNFSDWSDDMARFTMEPVTHSIAILDTLIPRLTPHVQTASTQLNRLIDVAGGAVDTPGFDAMADRFSDFTDRQLDEMTDGVIHFLRVLTEGGAITSGPIAEFMAYAKQNGPAAREALRALSDALVTLLRGAAEAGPGLLTLITYAAKLVAAFPPELIGIILQVATALKLLQLSGAGFAALAGGLAAVRTQIATLGAASAAAGGGLAGLRAAFLALGTAARASVIVAGIAALAYVLIKLSDVGKKAPPDVDKLTTSLRQLGSTGKTTGEAARAFGKDLEGLYDSVRSLTDPSSTDDVQQWIVSIGGLADWDSTPVKEAKENIDAIDKSLANLVKNGQADLAREALKKLSAEYGKGGRDTSEFTDRLDDYKSAMADAAFEAELAAQSQGLFGRAAQATQAKLEEQKRSADGLRQSIQALNDVNRAAGSAMSAFEQSIDDATEAVKDHAGALKMRDGELDLGSEKAREAEKVLSELAANTDAAAAAARDQGKSWEHVNGIMSDGRKAFIDAADGMGLTRAQAEALADSYLKIPDKKSTLLEMRTEDAITGLDSVIAAIKRTPDAKSVTVKALTTDAQSMLEDLGFKVVQLKDGRFKVTADTKTAKDSLHSVKRVRDGLQNKTITINATTQDAITDLEAVKKKVASTNGKTITMKAPTAEARKQLEALGFKIRDTKGKNVVITVPTGSQRANVGALASAIASLRNRSVTVTYTTVYRIQGRPGGPPSGTYHGSTAGRSADGNIYGPARVQRFADGGMRENHVAQIAQPTYRMWAEPETGGEAYIPFALSKRPRSRAIAAETVRRLGGDPRSISWHADGSVTDWRYDPSTGSLYSPSDAGQAGRKTRKVKGKEQSYFDLGAVERKLKSASAATRAWNADLERVADRVGVDVAQALASMGAEGVKLADKMARGSTKYINEMAAALRGLQATAKASLTDYTRELGAANKVNQTFANNLAKLAGQGYGDLAAQLAEQNDETAQQLAAAAVRDPKKAKAANAQVTAAGNTLTQDELATLVAIIAAVKTKTTGMHDVSGSTGIGEDVIIAVANKAKGQLSSALGPRSPRFLSDLAKANAGKAYANGGIRAGIYATQSGIMRFAEPETGGEAFLPLGSNKRRSAMPVLADVARRFGVGLTDGQAGRPVVVVQGGDTITVPVTNTSPRATASDIGAQVGYQFRRAKRGGVAAHAGAR
ncbi:hypothetical protein ACIP2X_37835 [Streptomyces sp. NPDC089424]|uniref:hypothetical protein n=1 Tax=Streptomyces sp. NPDC089424 TaxID=3365917 RepID=UPI00381AE02A